MVSRYYKSPFYVFFDGHTTSFLMKRSFDSELSSAQMQKQLNKRLVLSSLPPLPSQSTHTYWAEIYPLLQELIEMLSSPWSLPWKPIPEEAYPPSAWLLSQAQPPTVLSEDSKYRLLIPVSLTDFSTPWHTTVSINIIYLVNSKLKQNTLFTSALFS